MLQLVLECEQKSGTDSELTFWQAYSLAMESKGQRKMGVCFLTVFFVDSISETMRELETIQDKRDTVLCSAMLLVYAHKKCKTVGMHNERGAWVHECINCIWKSII